MGRSNQNTALKFAKSQELPQFLPVWDPENMLQVVMTHAFLTYVIIS